MRSALLAASFAAISALHGSSGVAAPLEVRAAATLETTPLRSGAAWHVRFVLRRDDTEPVALAALDVRIGDAPPITAVTDASGAVVMPLNASTTAGLVAWTVRLPGSPTLAGAEFRGAIDLRRVPTRLSIAAPTSSPLTLSSGRATVHLSLTAADADATPLRDATLRLRLGGGPFRSARTGPDGTLGFVIDPALLPISPDSDAQSGALRVDASFEGDAMFGPSSASATLPRALLSRITLRVAREGDTSTGRLRFSGRVAHELGAHAGALVRVELKDGDGERRVSVPALSDADGIWNAGVPLDTLRRAGIGRAVVTAISAPAVDIGAATSRELRIEVPSAPGRSALLPLGVLAALIALYAWFGRGRQRQARDGLQRLVAAVAGALRGGAGHVLAFLRKVTRKLRKMPRGGDAAPRFDPDAFVPARTAAPSRDTVRLDFLDRDTGRALTATATLLTDDGVELGGATGERVVLTGDHRGPVRLVVSGPGLIPLEVRASLPHDGTLDGATVRVRRVERRLRELHERVARRLGDEPAWGRDTPREVAGRLAARARLPGGQGAFEALVRAVEAAYFGPTPPEASSLAPLEALVEEPEARPLRRTP
jgi:hypothetical protein